MRDDLRFENVKPWLMSEESAVTPGDGKPEPVPDEEEDEEDEDDFEDDEDSEEDDE